MPALTEDRYLDIAKDGYTLTQPVSAAGTYYKGGAMVYTGGRVAKKSAGANQIFAGFVETQVMATAQDDDIVIRVPDRIWIPWATAALTHRGQRIDLTADDGTIKAVAVGTAVLANDTQLGLCVQVEVGVRVLVDTRRTA